MTLAVISSGPADETSHRPLGAAIACLPGLPQAARDAFWATDALKVWQPEWPAPGAPSAQLVAQLLNVVTDNQAMALGASIDDPTVLDKAVRALRSSDLWKGAAINPFLDPDTSDHMASRKDGVALVADRRAARQALADHLASPSGGDPEAVAVALVEAREAVVCARLLAERGKPALCGAEAAVADAVHTLLVEAGWGAKGAAARSTRRGALALLAKANPAALASFGFALAENPYGVVDPGALDAIAAAMAAGTVTAESFAANIDADAAAWAELRSDEVAQLIDEPTVVPLERKKALNPFAEKRIGTKAEWQALALLGMTTASCRAALSSSEPLSDSELADALAEADIETVVDWAEKRMPHRPLPGQVLAMFCDLDRDRAKELAAEVDRRHGSTESNPELALCLPGAAARPVPTAAARAVRAHIERTIGSDPAPWSVVATLIEDGWEGTLVELAEAAVLTTDD